MTALVKAFHIDDGETLMFPIDAAHATSNFPQEWSKEPWPAKAAAKPAKVKAPAAATEPQLEEEKIEEVTS